MARLIVVYHDPGREEGHGIARSLAAEAGEVLGVKWQAVPISVVEEGRQDFRRGDTVAALLPFRGGHWATVREAALEAGSRAYRIPVEVAAWGAAEALRGAGCSEVVVLYWPAKRFVEEQREDLERLKSLLASATGARVGEARVGELRCGECTVATSMLPGRLTGFIERECKGRGVGYLLEPPAARIAVKSWLVGIAQATLGSAEE